MIFAYMLFDAQISSKTYINMILSDTFNNIQAA